MLKSPYLLLVKWVSESPVLGFYEVGAQKTISDLISFSQYSKKIMTDR